MIVFDYFDYRKFLRDFYDEHKKENPFFSYRYMGRRVDLDPGYLVKVLQGKCHIAQETITKIAVLCKLSEKEAEYFETLVYFGKAKSEKQIKLYFEKLISFKGVKTKTIAPYQYEYYQKWYHSAIRSLIGFYEFNEDYKVLAQKLSPSISVKEAKDSVKLLEKLNFIIKDENGIYRLTDTLITTGDEWRSIAVRQFQRQTIQLALESLERHEKEQRDISTVTIAVSQRDLEEIKDRIKQFRASIMELAEQCADPDTVYQLNVQLVPLTGVTGKKA